MTLEDILVNISQYKDNIDDLVSNLRDLGINNFDEVVALAREFEAPIPRGIREAIKDKFENMEEYDWATAKASNTLAAYQEYLNKYSEGAYRNIARDAMMMLKNESVIDEAWAVVNKTDLVAVQNFITKNPRSKYEKQAWEIIKSLGGHNPSSEHAIKKFREYCKNVRTDKTILDPTGYVYNYISDELSNNRLTTEDLIDAIKQDNNLLWSSVIRQLCKNNKLTDLHCIGIPNEVIDFLDSGKELEAFPPVPSPTSISKAPCTEMYFWGIPASGKSCALGAILSSANSGDVALSMQPDSDCQGYGYLNRLSNLFNLNRVCLFPPGNATSATYEMGFDLEDNDGKIHPITCVDLAGELIGAMYKVNAKEPLTQEQEAALTTLTNMLVDNRTKNRKVHFFVLEYGAEDKEYLGLPQNFLLQAAAEYIKKTGVFNKDTDRIAILMTKVDKANAVGEELTKKLKDYILANYKGFYNTLTQICRLNEINRGKVNILPFTVGQVYFQNYSIFKDESAAAVVRFMLEISYCYKPSKLRKLIDKLSN